MNEESGETQAQRPRHNSIASITSTDSTEEYASNEPKDVMGYCRFRPFIKFELSGDTDRKAQCSVAFHKLGKNALLKYGVEKPQKFDFDRVFSMSSTQVNLFDVVGVPVVQGIHESEQNVGI